LVATVVPGQYARDVRRRHEEAQRLYDENTLRVLASVALWQRRSESPTCLREAESVLRAFCAQSGAILDTALDPHAAAAAKVLLRGDPALAESAKSPTGRAFRASAATAVARAPGAARQTRTDTRDPARRIGAHA